MGLYARDIGPGPTSMMAKKWSDRRVCIKALQGKNPKFEPYDLKLIPDWYPMVLILLVSKAYSGADMWAWAWAD